jgi:GxxExxY protein
MLMGYSEVTEKIIAAALNVHSAIGPGVLESVYKTCLAHELRQSGMSVLAEAVLPVLYKGLRLDSGFRIDLLVADLVIVELKCVDALLPIHKAQLLTYLRLGNKPIGLLLNFNVVHMREGISRVIKNKHPFFGDSKESGSS